MANRIDDAKRDQDEGSEVFGALKNQSIAPPKNETAPHRPHTCCHASLGLRGCGPGTDAESQSESPELRSSQMLPSFAHSAGSSRSASGDRAQAHPGRSRADLAGEDGV